MVTGLCTANDRFPGRLSPEARALEMMKVLKVTLALVARVGGVAELNTERLRERAAPDRSMAPIDVLTAGSKLFRPLKLALCPSTAGQRIAVEAYRPGEFRVVERLLLLIGAEDVEMVRSYEYKRVRYTLAEAQTLLRHTAGSLNGFGL